MSTADHCKVNSISKQLERKKTQKQKTHSRQLMKGCVQAQIFWLRPELTQISRQDAQIYDRVRSRNSLPLPWSQPHIWRRAGTSVWGNRFVNTNGWNDFPPEGLPGSALKRGGQSRATAAHCQADMGSGVRSRCASRMSPWRASFFLKTPCWEETLRLSTCCREITPWPRCTSVQQERVVLTLATSAMNKSVLKKEFD